MFDALRRRFSLRENTRRSFTELTHQGLMESKFFEEVAEPDGEETQYWKNRRVINRHTPINKGVSLTWTNQGRGFERDAVVVDDEADHILQKTYQQFEQALSDNPEVLDDITSLLNFVWEFVADELVYDRERTSQLKTDYLIREGIHVETLSEPVQMLLGQFIEGQAGICKQQALLAGYLIEKLLETGRLHGKVSVRRSFVEGSGGHSYVSFLNEKDQKEYIVDPAMGLAMEIEHIENPNIKKFYLTEDESNHPEIGIVETVTTFWRSLRRSLQGGGERRLLLDGGNVSLRHYESVEAPHLDLTGNGVILSATEISQAQTIGLKIHDRLLSTNSGDITFKVDGTGDSVQWSLVRTRNIASVQVTEKGSIPRWQDVQDDICSLDNPNAEYHVNFRDGQSLRLELRNNELDVIYWNIKD